MFIHHVAKSWNNGTCGFALVQCWLCCDVFKSVFNPVNDISKITIWQDLLFLLLQVWRLLQHLHQVILLRFPLLLCLEVGQYALLPVETRFDVPHIFYGENGLAICLIKRQLLPVLAFCFVVRGRANRGWVFEGASIGLLGSLNTLEDLFLILLPTTSYLVEIFNLAKDWSLL